MKILKYKRWSIQDAEAHPYRVFIFGDNCQKRGTGGQACIRYSSVKNAYGIPTKKLPTMNEDAFFTDDEYEQNIKIIDEAIAKIPIYQFIEIAILKDGLGTGLAQMPTKCPKTFKYLQEKIKEFVDYYKTRSSGTKGQVH